ncbi:MAG: S9 family peptidase [Fimbriimonadaceae bacterium]|nr:S9 family peptidase [Fimbriimonadaceae bacterium]
MRASSLLALWLLPVPILAQLDPGVAVPPKARKEPVATTLHGDTRVDEYGWLRKKGTKEVNDYLNAENAYTKAVMKPTEALQKRLYDEIVGRIKETDLDVPVFDNGFYYYSRTVKGQSYPIYCRRKGAMTAKEQVLVDLNELGKGRKFIDLGTTAVSDDGNLLAYTIDTTGFREYQLYIKDLRTGRLLPDRVGKVSQVEWAADNKTLWYVTEDDAKRWNKVWRYRVGSRAKGTPVYEEKDRLYWFYIGRSRDKQYLFLTSSSAETSEVRTIPCASPAASPRLVVKRRDKHEYSVDHREGLFYIRTNDKGRNFRLVVAPASDPSERNWKQVIAHRDDQMLAGVDLFKRYMVVSERRGGFPVLLVTDLTTFSTKKIATPEKVYSIDLGANPSYDPKSVRYAYTSYQTPNSVYDYDPATGSSKLLKRQPVLGGFRPEDYVSELRYAVASDGTKVPISLVRHRNTRLSPTTPLLLTGYGAYGAPSFPYFSTSRLSLLNRGVVYATAHVRGGGEMGTRWHDDGKMMKKMNTFTDFIACADALVGEGATSRERLAIEGGSAGGLLIGAVLNLRPDLCGAAIAQVPFVDLLNTMLDDSLPLTTGEWLEWGNPNKPAEYATMRRYCPYTNVGAHEYPNLLIDTSLNDSQVMYFEPAKWTARLRDRKRGDRVLLLRTNMDAGHGGASGRYDAIKETAFDYAFLLTLWGITK